MKSPTLLSFSFALLANGLSMAQAPPMIEPVPGTANPGTPQIQGNSPNTVPVPAAGNTTPLPLIEPVDTPPPLNTSANQVPAIPAADPVVGTGAAPFSPLEKQKREMEQAADGFIIKDASLNEIFEFLAKSAGKQYFHNMKISGPDYLVTGHLNDGNPLQQMEELAFMYGLSLHTKGSTIYALTQSQLSQLPSTEFHYQLKYLRPADIENIKELIKPMLSPGTGLVQFEPKTNTVIVIDSAHRIEQVQDFLHSIDQAKGQIVVETKILRINSKSGERQGINWAGALGENGTAVSLAANLNGIFGLKGPSSSVGNITLSSVQLTGVLRALAEGNLAKQVSNPTLITEDNEMASISIIDRIPIITTTSTQTTTGGNPTVTEEVRYKIDSDDKSISDDPEKHREIGISLVVTPTLLPDGTIRMKMRPRSAQIAEYVKSTQTGNVYPRVTESMLENIARVPDGSSLVVGGFYGETQNRDRNKVPVLGDIPVINFFFKSKDTQKEESSLVFIITPRSYNPTNPGQTASVSNQIHGRSTIERDHDWIDPANPGPAHEPNLGRSARGLQPEQAPYYPRPEELDRNIQPAPVPKKKAPQSPMRLR